MENKYFHFNVFGFQTANLQWKVPNPTLILNQYKTPNMHIKIPFTFWQHIYVQGKNTGPVGHWRITKTALFQEYRHLHADVASNTLHCTELVPLSLAVADV